jgi:hypothetical protein
MTKNGFAEEQIAFALRQSDEELVETLLAETAAFIEK